MYRTMRAKVSVYHNNCTQIWTTRQTQQVFPPIPARNQVEPWIERVKALGAQGVTWENDAAYKEIQEDLTNHLRERLLEVEAQARPYLYGGSGKGKKARKGRK
uniref:Uncharacterized protein n=1 Tax=Heterosigma akashiwo TaxID=2829 RepID=A0A7S3Y707_HETAK